MTGIHLHLRTVHSLLGPSYTLEIDLENISEDHNTHALNGCKQN